MVVTEHVKIPDGFYMDVIEEIFTDQIIITDGKFSVLHRWTYDRGRVGEPSSPITAQDAAIEWESRNLKGEPWGWVRHQPSNRRRKYVEREGAWIVQQEYMSP